MNRYAEPIPNRLSLPLQRSIQVRGLSMLSIYALLAGLGALRIMAGQFTVGSLTTFSIMLVGTSKPFNDISSVLSELQSALACADRLFAILALDSIDDQAERKINSEELKGAISFDNVSFFI